MMKKPLSDRIYLSIVYVGVGLFSLITIYPVLLSFAVSISDNLLVEKFGYKIIPMKLSLDAYLVAFKGGWIEQSFFITILVTFIGTVISLTLMSLYSYTMAVKKVKYRNILAMFCFITMIFSPGIVPTYIIVTQYYKLTDSIWSLIVPYLVNPWYLFLMRNYFSTIHPSLEESAEIDGANVIQKIFIIVLPLSKPILATVGLFVALVYWNDWWLALLYVSNKKLFPMQYWLFNLLSSIEFLTSGEAANAGLEGRINLPRETVKMATTFITIGPVILLYPFLQRFFIKGIMIGAIKG